jgi:hypothetical protein
MPFGIVLLKIIQTLHYAIQVSVNMGKWHKTKHFSRATVKNAPCFIVQHKNALMEIYRI